MTNLRSGLRYCTTLLCLVIIAPLTGCRPGTAPALNPSPPGLVVFTYQEKAVYEPILKEYRERTGLPVQVLTGTYEELQERILAGTLADDCDVVFGINSATLDQTPDAWEPYISPLTDSLYQDFYSPDGLWTGFSALPLVIMYNTRVVTYRELPVGWKSLLEPRWSGLVAFMDPELSDTYAGALAAATFTAGTHDSTDDRERFVEDFLKNLEYRTFDSISNVNSAIAEGRCFLGVTLEEKAESLRREGADVDYIYPKEGTFVLIDSSAITAGCKHPEQARDFIDFTISKDVQHYLSSAFFRRSVRTDGLTPSGLSHLTQLPILSIAPGQMAGQYQAALEQWTRLRKLQPAERR